MGFKGVTDVTLNTTGYNNYNRNVELVTFDEGVFIKITLNSEFPLYEGYESLVLVIAILLIQKD